MKTNTNQSIEILNDELSKTCQELFNLRMQNGIGQLSQKHLLKYAKRKIARIKTILARKMKMGEK